MLEGRERLAAWMRRAGLNQRETARELGFHWTVINKILKGTRFPGLRTASRIEAVTGIPMTCWLPTHVGKASKARHSERKSVHVGGV